MSAHSKSRPKKQAVHPPPLLEQLCAWRPVAPTHLHPLACANPGQARTRPRAPPRPPARRLTAKCFSTVISMFQPTSGPHLRSGARLSALAGPNLVVHEPSDTDTTLDHVSPSVHSGRMVTTDDPNTGITDPSDHRLRLTGPLRCRVVGALRDQSGCKPLRFRLQTVSSSMCPVH